MSQLDPKNLPAQLAYRGEGNPPSTHPTSAISNCYPGLEMDFRNVWRRIFVGIELHEADNLVVAVDPDTPAAVQALLGHRLQSVDGGPVVTPVTGPKAPVGPRTLPEPGEPERPLETIDPRAAMEWSNALADLLTTPGSDVTCRFLAPPDFDRTVTAVLHYRPFFDGAAHERRPVVSRDLVGPATSHKASARRGRTIAASAPATTGPPAVRISSTSRRRQPISPTEKAPG